ncbi:MAG: hypothetical protein J0G30_13775 [Actinomycetales bacterium]|nr:hypothetical protein [Actinomycetales bacterium]
MTPIRHPRRRRAAVAVIAAALLAPAFVLGGAIAAAAAPNPPVITSPAGTSAGSPAPIVLNTFVSGTVTQDDTNLQYLRFFVDGVLSASCQDQQVPVGTTSWGCSLSVPTGDHTIEAYVAADPTPTDFSTASNTVYVRVGTAAPAAFTSPSDSDTLAGLTPTLAGTGPAMGTVTVTAQSRFTPAGVSTVCLDAPVDAAGDWSCTASFPDDDWWTITATGTTVTGVGTAPDSIDVMVAPGLPSVTITPVPGGATAVITSSETGANSSAWWEQRPADGSGPFQVATCPDADWAFMDGSHPAPIPPDNGASIPCDALALGPGVHLLSSNQWVNDANSSQRPDLIRIPNSPEIDGSYQWGGGVEVYGRIDQIDDGAFAAQSSWTGVTIDVATATGIPVCSVDLGFEDTYWYCDGDLPVGDYAFVARATSTGFAGGSYTYPAPTQYVDGISSDSAPGGDLTVIPSPVVTHSFAAGSARTTVTGTSGSWVGTEIYRLTWFDGGEGGYYSYDFLTACDQNSTSTCDSALSAGLWEFRSFQYSSQSAYECGECEPGLWQYDYVLVPNTPTFSATPNSAGVVTFAGSSDPGTAVRVLDGNGSTVCAATANGSGSWSCATSPGYGTFAYRAVAQSVGFVMDPSFTWEGDRSFDGVSAASAPQSIVIAPPPIATPEAILAFLWKFGITGIPDGGLHPGDSFTITGDGLPPGTIIFVEMHSTPVQLGTATVDPTGSFTFAGLIPADAAPGAHEIVVTANVPGQGIVTQSQPITVMPAVAPTPTDSGAGAPDTTSDSTGSGGSGGGSVDRADPAAPSPLTELPTVLDVIDNPISLLAAGGLALGLLFLLAIPTELLTGVLTENGRTMGRGIARVDETLERAMGWLERVTHGRAAAALLLILVVAVIMGFSDPDFGLDLVSVRMVLSLAIGCFVLFYVLSWVNGRIARRLWDVEPEIDLKPMLAIFSVLGVVISRLTGFSPGILLGVVIGLAIVRGSKRGELGVMLLQTGSIVAVAVLAWFGYSALGANGPATDFGTALLHDTLAAITDEALSGAAVAILPLAFLEGRVLWERSKLAWVATFLVIETVFCLIVLPTALEQTDASQIGIWYLALAIFGALTFALWFVMVRRERRHAHAAAAAGRADADGDGQAEATWQEDGIHIR